MPVTTAATDQVGQGLKGALGASEAVQKLSKGHRPDLVGPRQTQARETLCVRQGHPFFAPIRGSAPFRMRAIFSWWRTQIRAAVTRDRTNTGPEVGRPRASIGKRA